VPFPNQVPGQASGVEPGVDPFFNANRPEDLDRAAALLERLEL
jgi:molybdopterin-guanine dinucleotide biosynthesis protein A